MFTKILLIGLMIVTTLFISTCQNTSSSNNQVTDKKAAALAEVARRANSPSATKNLATNQEVATPDFYLFWYNQAADKKAVCDGRYFVKSSPRFTKHKDNLIRQAFEQLFSGELTNEEKEQGFVAGPFSGGRFRIKNFDLDQQGVLRIDLVDNTVLDNFVTDCWVQNFVFSIQNTAQQFPEITRVVFDHAFDFHF